MTAAGIWKVRNISRELFREVVRRIRCNGVPLEMVLAEVERVYAAQLSEEDLDSIKTSKIPKGWL